MNLHSQNLNPSPQSIQDTIAHNITCEYIEVTGDGRHFFATIVSDIFTDKSKIQRHKIVYACLGDRMREEIHALSIKTLSISEWKNNG